MARHRFLGLLLGCSLLLVSLTLSAGTALAVVAPQIAAGGYHTLALMSDGTVKAWGANASGQLGNGTTVNSTIPVAVSGLSGEVTQIAAGGSHTVALMSDGTVKAWGANSSGQLGNGTTVNNTTPMAVSGLSGVVKQIATAAGGSHTVALMADGTVKAWGYNYYGQLGNGTVTNSWTPVTVTGLEGVTQIVAGTTFTAALLSDGTVKAWGDNYYGQLGDGTTVISSVPVTVVGLGGAVTKIAAGNNHIVALMSNGSVKTWGDNYRGQLGNGTTVSSRIPVMVNGLGGEVTMIAAGGYNTSVFLVDGTAMAWGMNNDGQLGDGTTTDSNTAVTVTGLGNTVAQLSAGGFHTVALLADGTVKSWGYNAFGQLGNGMAMSSSSPVSVVGLVGTVTQLAAGSSNSLALMSAGTVYAWGWNESGQLGAGTTTNAYLHTPVAVTGLGGTVVQVAAFGDSNLLLLADGTVKAWGSNFYGQLGNGTTSSYSSTPLTVGGLGGVVKQVASGGTHMVALLADGTVKAWGHNNYGQLGNGTIANSITPVTVTGLGGTVVSVKAGAYFTVALLANGTVKAWGCNNSGQLGNGTWINSPTPVTVTGLGGVAAIVVGGGHTLALLSNGTVKTWGHLSVGVDRNTPMTVSGLEGTVTAIAAGGSHNVALLSDGTVKAWGDNTYGQLGDGTVIRSSTPVTVNGLGGTVAAIGAGDNHTMALLTDGTVKGWGDNAYGQLGDGNDTFSPITTLINLDNVAPTVTADLPSGNYDGSVMVELNCIDDYSGCQAIRYTDDGNIPTASSSLYTGPLSISNTTTLTFLATDKAGNSSGIQSVSYTIPIKYSLGLTVSGNGTVYTSPGSDMACRSGCSQNYLDGEVVTLIATPDPGYALARWSNCTGTVSCQVTMDAAKSVEATFVPLIPVTLLTPNGGETLLDGTSTEISWVAATGAAYYDLSYSLDGGTSWTFIRRAQGVTSASWKLPDVNGDQNSCVVRVIARDAALKELNRDLSNASFILIDRIPVVLLSPNGGETLLDLSTISVSWSPAFGAVSYDLSYSLNNGTSWTFVKRVSGTSTSWTLPDVGGDQNNCLVRVIAKDGELKALNQDVSNATFTIIDRTLAAVLMPNGGEVYTELNAINLSWSPATGATYYDLVYSLNGGTSWIFIKRVTGVTSTNWKLPEVAADQPNCLVRVTARDSGLVFINRDQSNAVFTLRAN